MKSLNAFLLESTGLDPRYRTANKGIVDPLAAKTPGKYATAAESKKVKNDAETFVKNWSDVFYRCVDNFRGDMEKIFERHGYNIFIGFETMISFTYSSVFVLEGSKNNPTELPDIEIEFDPAKGIDIKELMSNEYIAALDPALKNDFRVCVSDFSKTLVKELKGLKVLYKQLVNDIDKFGIDIVKRAIAEAIVTYEKRGGFTVDELLSDDNCIGETIFVADCACYPITQIFDGKGGKNAKIEAN